MTSAYCLKFHTCLIELFFEIRFKWHMLKSIRVAKLNFRKQFADHDHLLKKYR